MPDSIDQQVIDFVTTWCDAPVGSVSLKTTFEDLGVTGEDRVQLIMELEDSFGLTYETGDDKGIYNVGEASDLIHRKLNG